MLNGTHVLEGLRDMGKLVMVASYVGYYIEGVPPEASLTALMGGTAVWVVGCAEKEV